MNEDELVANLFRINQTKQKILKDNVQGEKEAKDVHYEVGKKVRKAIADIGGTMPEEMPTPKKSLKELERERKKIEIKEQGAVCVEMECVCIAAVCKYRNLDYFTFYYAGDNMDAIEWDERSLNQLTNFEKKKLVPYLAFELARKISDIRGC